MDFSESLLEFGIRIDLRQNVLSVARITLPKPFVTCQEGNYDKTVTKTLRPTINDVARAAGVSATTVSHALNGKGRVDEATRLRVRDAVERIGYVPSRTARNLVTGASDTIGLLLPRFRGMSMREALGTDWYGRVAVTTSQAILDHDRAMTLLPRLDSLSDIHRFALDGIIILDPVADDPRCSLVASAGLPHVLLGRDPAHPQTFSTSPDTEAGIQALLEHLAAQGARSISILATDIDWQAGRSALDTYRAWTADNHVTADIVIAPTAECATREAIRLAAASAARDLLTRESRPDAIIGLLEDFGSGIIRAADDLSIRVPEDLLVAQDIDGLKMQLNRPSITAVDLHPDLQISAAVQQLTTLIEGQVPEQHITTPTSLHIRESTFR